MIYKTSKDYERLYHLLYEAKQDVFGSSIMDLEDRERFANDPYFRKYECFRHNKAGEMTGVFGNERFKDNFELFRAFCDREDVDFVDPADGQQDLNLEMYALLKRFLEVFEQECHISCARCHELRDTTRALLEKVRTERTAGPCCVQQDPDCRTQTALRPTDGTQRRNVWHDHEDIPHTFNNDVIAVTINDTWFKMPVSDLQAFLSGSQRPMIRKWAFIKDLEAL